MTVNTYPIVDRMSLFDIPKPVRIVTIAPSSDWLKRDLLDDLATGNQLVMDFFIRDVLPAQSLVICRESVVWNKIKAPAPLPLRWEKSKEAGGHIQGSWNYETCSTFRRFLSETDASSVNFFLIHDIDGSSINTESFLALHRAHSAKRIILVFCL